MKWLPRTALSVKVFSQFTVRPLSRFSIDDLGKHTILTGILARKIAIAEGLSKQEVEDSFMAGLLHDIGKLVLVTSAPGKYEEEMKFAEVIRVPRRDAERTMFGTTHAEIGTTFSGCGAFRTAWWKRSLITMRPPVVRPGGSDLSRRSTPPTCWPTRAARIQRSMGQTYRNWIWNISPIWVWPPAYLSGGR